MDISRSKRLLLVAGAVQLAIAGCSTPQRLPAVPVSAMLPGEPDIRTNSVSGIAGPIVLPRKLAARVARSRRGWRARVRSASFRPFTCSPFRAAATMAPTEPVFSTAGPPPGPGPNSRSSTGISTGALIAPFAFIGPKYDHVIKTVYTSTAQKDIFKKRKITAALFGDSMADTRPLAKVIRSYVTPDFLHEIAAEYARAGSCSSAPPTWISRTSHLEHDRDRRQPGSGRNCAVPAHLAGIGLHSRRLPARHDRCRPRRD